MKLKNDFLEALLKEVALRKNFLERETIETVYFGGGTPSLLSEVEFAAIINAIVKNFHVSPEAEITLEANPDDVTKEKLIGWQQNLINRLSIGVQSFFETDLLWMNRAHDAGQAEQSIKMAQDMGYSNITIDLIFGTPELTDGNWYQNIQKTISMDIPHISCYALTVENGTALEKRIAKKISPIINSDDQARQFLLTQEWLSDAGYEQYEISNYAVAGYRSKHNSSYWQGKKYLGLGPSAHSYDQVRRQWNIANNALYVQSLHQNVVPFEAEVLTGVQRVNEWIMTSLRRMEGLSISPVSPFMNQEIIDHLKKKARRFQHQGLINDTGNALVLTSNGRLYADGIAADLFLEEKEIRNSAYAADS